MICFKSIFPKAFRCVFIISLFFWLLQSSLLQGGFIQEKDATAIFNEGVELYKNGEYFNAVRNFLRAEELSKDKKILIDINTYLSLCYFAIGDSESTMNRIRKILGNNPEMHLSSLFYPVGYIKLFNQVRLELQGKRQGEKVKKRGAFSLSIMGYYFQPSEKIFQDIYGSAMSYGGGIGINIWKGLDIWAEGNFYKGTGKLTFTEENTKMQIIPIFGGIRFKLSMSKFVPYIGVGAGYFSYREKNSIVDISGGSMGYVGQLGFIFRIISILCIDMQINYHHCEVKTEDVKTNLGGLKMGVGLVFEF